MNSSPGSESADRISSSTGTPPNPSRQPARRPAGALIRLDRCTWALGVAGLLATASPAFAVTYSVVNGGDTGAGSGTSGDLRYCITQANANPGSTIVIKTYSFGLITLTSSLPVITTSMTIRPEFIGDYGLIIDGGGLYRAFFVNAPNGSVTFTGVAQDGPADFVIRNCRAKGGDGGPAAGGGLGAGGAIFVNAGQVTAEHVVFRNNVAIGGKGGNGSDNNRLDGGGGGGLGGNGGTTSGGGVGGGGGGGFMGNGGNGVNDGSGGGGGLIGRGGNGAAGSSAGEAGGGGGAIGNGGDASPTTGAVGAGGSGGGGAGGGGTSGVDGGNGSSNGGGGGGGTRGTSTNASGGNGGTYGGGGGAGGPYVTPSSSGNGGEFGGGGGNRNVYHGISGDGGWGGGGGGGAKISTSSSGHPGAGGYGGGGGGTTFIQYARPGGTFGGQGGASTYNGTFIYPAGGGGGGALGGAVFVRSNSNGANFQALDCSFSGSSVTAGAAGDPSAISNSSRLAGAGTALGPAIFFGDTQLSVGGSGNSTIAESLVADPSATAANLAKGGTGTLTLGSANFYNGQTAVLAGVLRLGADGCLGSTTNPLAPNLSGAVDLNGFSPTVGRLYGSSASTIYNGTYNTQARLTIGADNISGVECASVLRNGTSDPESEQDGLYAGLLGLTKTGTGTSTLTGLSTFSLGTIVNGGSLNLGGADSSGKGTLIGDVVINAGGTLSGTVSNAFGYADGRKINSITVNGGTLLHSSPRDQGWGIAYTLNNGAIMDLGSGSDSTSTWAFGGPGPGANTRVNVTGATPSEIRGRVTLRNDNNNTANSFTVANGSTLKVPAAIGNQAAVTTWPTLVKEGPGLMTLSNTNTYLGNTVVNGGTLELSGTRAGGFGTIVGGVTVNSGAAVKATVTDAFGYASGGKLGSIVVNNSGQLLHASPGNQGWSVGYTLNNGGTMDFTTGSDATSAWAFGGATGFPTSVSATGAAASQIKGRVDLRGDNGNTVATFNVAGDATTTSTLNVPAVIFSSTPAAPPTLTKTGSGILVLSGTNTYPGATNLAAGTLAVTNDSALGNGGQIQFNGGTLRFDYPSTQDFAVRFAAPASGKAVRIDTNGNAVSLATPIPGAGSLMKLGASTLTLTGTQTYAGGTTISGGTLRLGNGTTAGSITGNVTNAGTLEFASPGAQSFSGLISGAGSVTKSGTGTLTLTGAQTYTGNTTISSGTLRLGDGTSLGSIAGNVANAGTLEFAAPGAQSFGGLISGTGGVTKSGSGTLTLTGAQTYTGNTAISAGTLRLGDGTAAGSLAGNVTNAGALEFASPGAQSYSGVISGAGTMTKSGTGTLTLSGAQTYTGTTTISGGTLRLGNGTTSGSLTGNVANAGTLEFASPGLQSYGGIISGAGGVTHSGAGTLTLTGAQTYTGTTTISTGTLRLGDGTTGGSLAGNVENAGTLEFASPGTQSFSGVISGAGGLIKSGSGGLTLTSAQTYSGPTVVNSGSLTVSSTASLSSSAVTIAASADLNGSGEFNGTVSLSGNLIANGGTLNAGLTVNGGGLATADNGTFTVKGAILNNGTIRVTGGAKFLAGEATSFVNNGVLDLITADPAFTLPAGFTNGPDGIVLTRDSLRVKDLTLATDASTVTIRIDGYTGHGYTLQRSATPADADFHTLPDVAAQNGTTGSLLTFTDAAPSASEPFYRLVVAP